MSGLFDNLYAGPQAYNPVTSLGFDPTQLNLGGGRMAAGTMGMGAGAPQMDWSAGFGGAATDMGGAAAPSGLFAGLGANVGTLQLGLQGLGQLGSLFAGFKGLGLAQKQFDLQKSLSETNLRNSTQSYNTQITDRATSRAVQNGQSASERDAWIAANSLSR